MIVALLSDFGTRDHYAGVMKGVVLSVCPSATLVDITHDVPAHDVVAGALELSAAYRYFPPGTVFLAVVDPGVGSPRRGIAAAAGGYYFVGPDNGLLSLAIRDAVSTTSLGAPAEPSHVVELADRTFARSTVSRTFEGRDRFAPAAAWLARGTELDAFGPPVHDMEMLSVPVAAHKPDGIHGEVVRIDRFGNLITNITAEQIKSFSTDAAVVISGHHTSRVVGTYADARPGEVCALIGSSGHLEVAVNGGNAADTLRASRGSPVYVHRP